MTQKPAAIVMNMFRTGLGIARSLGEAGIRVIGLSAHRESYGAVTRYARTLRAPDSRTEPEKLLEFLLALGPGESGAVVFPTRDDDVLFLDRFRDELSRYFRLAIPARPALAACLDKWETYRHATRAGAPAPKSWLIDGEPDIVRAAAEINYPCVLKPVAASDWRQSRNWELVGGRKAIPIASPDELIREYSAIMHANPRALLQEFIPGPDDLLTIAACYMDRNSEWVAGFNTRKLLQMPEGFGTGVIVETAHCPELLDAAARILREMRFTGIAEVEFKWDNAAGEHKLIEINPRPWDQHRLGWACGVDLILLSYCEHAGLPRPHIGEAKEGTKWIAEDAFLGAVISYARQRNPAIRSLFRKARGKRIYAIGFAKDPLPFLAYLVKSLIPQLVCGTARAAWSSLQRQRSDRAFRSCVPGANLTKGKSHD